MKIHLTKKEYRLLIEMLTISEWVMHSHHTDSNENCKQHDLVIQKLLSFNKDFTCEDLVHHDKANNKFYQSIIDDEGSPVNNLINEYENEVFWEELINRLARRDLAQKQDGKKVNEMDSMQRFEGISEESKKYYKEFEESGVDNLVLKKLK